MLLAAYPSPTPTRSGAMRSQSLDHSRPAARFRSTRLGYCPESGLSKGAEGRNRGGARDPRLWWFAEVADTRGFGDAVAGVQPVLRPAGGRCEQLPGGEDMEPQGPTNCCRLPAGVGAAVSDSHAESARRLAAAPGSIRALGYVQK